jgi:hypothetical protein
MAVNRTKVRHDCEQLEYLLGLGRLPMSYRTVLADYRSLLAEVESIGDDTLIVPFDERKHPSVARTYKRPIYVDAGAAPRGPLVNPDLDARTIEQSYVDAKPNVAAIDHLLTKTRARCTTQVLPRKHDLEPPQRGLPRCLLLRRVLLGAAAASRARIPRAVPADRARTAACR